MASWLLFLGLPLAVYVALVAVPSGRVAFWACAAVAVAVALAWAVVLLGPRGDAQRDAFILISLVGLTIAWALASTLQILRLRMPKHWPSWAWPACATVTLVATGLPLMRFLGL